MTRDQEIEMLRNIIIGNYKSLNSEGDEKEGFETVCVDNQESRRWSRAVVVTTKSRSGRLFQWYYDQGLTENQEDEFGSKQEIAEVKEFEEIVVVKKYKTITEEDSLKEEFTQRIESIIENKIGNNEFDKESGEEYFQIIMDYKYIVYFTISFAIECMTGDGATAIYQTTIDDLVITNINKIETEEHLIRC